MKSPKQMDLGQPAFRFALFAEMEQMAPGDVWEVASASQQDALAKRELAALRAWIYAERKRRKAEVLASVEAGNLPFDAVETADPLAGILVYAEHGAEGWRLVVSKPLPPRIIKRKLTQ